MAGPTAALIRSRRAPSPLHRRDSCVHDAAERATPAGVSGTNDAGVSIGEKDGCAVRCQHAECQAWCRCDDGVGLRARTSPRCVDGDGL